MNVSERALASSRGLTTPKQKRLAADNVFITGVQALPGEAVYEAGRRGQRVCSQGSARGWVCSVAVKRTAQVFTCL